MLPGGPLAIPNATSISIAATNGITIAATDNLVLSSSSGIIDFEEGSTVDFTGAIVTGLNVQLSGDLQGSVFGDDSTILVDAVNSKLVGDIDSTSMTVLSSTGFGVTVNNSQASILVNGQDGLTITNGAASVLGGSNGVEIVGAGSAPIIIGAGTAGNITLGNASSTIQLAASSSLDISDLTLINFANSVISGLGSGSVSYTPASSTNWNDDPPATIAAALDRIAARLGPIV